MPASFVVGTFWERAPRSCEGSTEILGLTQLGFFSKAQRNPSEKATVVTLPVDDDPGLVPLRVPRSAGSREASRQRNVRPFRRAPSR